MASAAHAVVRRVSAAGGAADVFGAFDVVVALCVTAARSAAVAVGAARRTDGALVEQARALFAGAVAVASRGWLAVGAHRAVGRFDARALFDVAQVAGPAAQLGAGCDLARARVAPLAFVTVRQARDHAVFARADAARGARAAVARARLAFIADAAFIRLAVAIVVERVAAQLGRRLPRAFAAAPAVAVLGREALLLAEQAQADAGELNADRLVTTSAGILLR